MKKGFKTDFDTDGKGIIGDYDIIKDYLVDKYGFAETFLCTLKLSRPFDKITVSTLGGKISVKVSAFIIIKEEKQGKAAIELMKLNREYPGLNLGIDEDGVLVNNHTIYTKEANISTEEFIDIFEHHMNCHDEHFDEIIGRISSCLATEFDDAELFRRRKDFDIDITDELRHGIPGSGTGRPIIPRRPLDIGRIGRMERRRLHLEDLDDPFDFDMDDDDDDDDDIDDDDDSMIDDIIDDVFKIISDDDDDDDDFDIDIDDDDFDIDLDDDDDADDDDSDGE